MVATFYGAPANLHADAEAKLAALQGYQERGVPEDEAERRAWATVNKVHSGGEKPGGGGYGKPEDREPMRKGGRKSHGEEEG